MPADETARLALKGEQLARERYQAEEERDALDRRQEEARASIVRLQDEQRRADERLTLAQRRLFEAREATEDLSRRAAEARAAHAAMVERAAALASEVQRLEEAAAELDARATALAAELDATRQRVDELRAAIVGRRGAARRRRARARHACEADVQRADDALSRSGSATDEQDASLKDARAARSNRSVRSSPELDVARATAESDLAHLAASCLDTVQATLDEVRAEVDELERAGNADAGRANHLRRRARGGDRRDMPAEPDAPAESLSPALEAPSREPSAPKRRSPVCAPRSIGSAR